VPRLRQNLLPTTTGEGREKMNYTKLGFIIGVSLVLIVSLVYFVAIPCSKPYNSITIKPTRTDAQACSFEVSGGQFLWQHSFFWGNIGVMCAVTITTDKVMLPTTAKLSARQGETFTVTITYYNQTTIENTISDGIQTQFNQWITIGVDKTEITIP
jgi:hypothetical protein